MKTRGRPVTSLEMQAIELNAEYLGVPSIQLMENAGAAVASQIALRFRPEDSRIMILSGTGGKGGDGMVAARHLADRGFKVRLLLIGCPEGIRREAVRRNWETLLIMADSLSVRVVEDSSLLPTVEGEVVVDALVGTGFRGKLQPPVSQVVDAVNAAGGFKVAVDLPTGVNPDGGDIAGNAVKADLTVTLHRTKAGVLESSGLVGEIVVAPIGVPPEAETLVGPGDVVLAAKPRAQETHKGDYGRLLVVGGSDKYHGAPTLAAMAAMRTGIDLTYVAVPEGIAQHVAAVSPALIVVKLKGSNLSEENVHELCEWVPRCSAVTLGPGLGLLPGTSEAVDQVVKAVENRGVPLLLDADGLKAFAEFKRPLKCPLVLTPHAGEYEILTGKRLPLALEERVRHVENTAQALKAVLLVKGAVDIVSDGFRTKLNRFVHNPGMTVGGTGDVLSGIVGALLSQGIDVFRAAAAGTFINGAAGDFAYRERGYHLLPDDLIDWIPRVMNSPMDHVSVRHL